VWGSSSTTNPGPGCLYQPQTPGGGLRLVKAVKTGVCGT
jgi:hypothetical protein